MSNVNDENKTKTKTINGKFVKVENNKNLDGKKFVAEIEVRKGGGIPRPKMPAWFKDWAAFEFKPFCEETKASIGELKADVKVMKADIVELKENDEVMKADIEVLKKNDEVMKADIEVVKADVKVLKENDKKQDENIQMIFEILDKNNIK